MHMRSKTIYPLSVGPMQAKRFNNQVLVHGLRRLNPPPKSLSNQRVHFSNYIHLEIASGTYCVLHYKLVQCVAKTCCSRKCFLMDDDVPSRLCGHVTQ